MLRQLILILYSKRLETNRELAFWSYGLGGWRSVDFAGGPYCFFQRYIVSDMKDVLYEVRCLKSNEDMILALTGQFKQLSHEPEKFRWLTGIRTHDLCDAGAVL